MLKDYTITVAAGAVTRRQIKGNYARIMALSAASIGIRLGQNQSGDSSGNWAVEYGTFALGEGFGPLPKDYDTVELYDPLGGGYTVTLALGDAVVQDNRLVGILNITGGIQQRGATTVTFGQVSVLSASATKIWTGTTNGTNNGKVQNLGAHDVWLGSDNTVAANKGVLLPCASGADADGNRAGAFLDGLDASVDLWGLAITANVTVGFMQPLTS